MTGMASTKKGLSLSLTVLRVLLFGQVWSLTLSKIKSVFLPAAKRHVKCWRGFLFFFQKMFVKKKGFIAFGFTVASLLVLFFWYFDLNHYFPLICISLH